MYFNLPCRFLDDRLDTWIAEAHLEVSDLLVRQGRRCTASLAGAGGSGASLGRVMLVGHQEPAVQLADALDLLTTAAGLSDLSLSSLTR